MNRSSSKKRLWPSAKRKKPGPKRGKEQKNPNNGSMKRKSSNADVNSPRTPEYDSEQEEKLKELKRRRNRERQRAYYHRQKELKKNEIKIKKKKEKLPKSNAERQRKFRQRNAEKLSKRRLGLQSLDVNPVPVSIENEQLNETDPLETDVVNLEEAIKIEVTETEIVPNQFETNEISLDTRIRNKDLADQPLNDNTNLDNDEDSINEKMRDDFEFSISFIQEVENNAMLYDYRHPDYTNRKETEASWHRIAKKYGEPASECKNKWRIIRSSYIRSLNSIKSGAKKDYYLEKYLRFLRPFTKHAHEDKLKPDEEGNDSTVYTSSIPGTQEEPSSSKTVVKAPEGNFLRAKRKLTDLESNEKEPCELFLQSIVPYMRSMTSLEQLSFQRAVLDLVENVIKNRTPPPQNNSSIIELAPIEIKTELNEEDENNYE